MQERGSELNDILPRVLPLLADYIRDNNEALVDDAILRRKDAALLQHATPAELLQLRVLRLIGTLPGDTIYYVIGDSAERASKPSLNPVKWSRDPCVKFTLPFRDMKTDIYLGM